LAALTINKAVLENGNRNYKATYNFVGDGANTISGYVAADPTATGDMGVTIAGNTLYPGAHMTIIGMRYNLAAGFSVQIIWDATSPTLAWTLFGFGKELLYREGGLQPYTITSGVATLLTGATGKILFTQKPDAALAAGVTGTIELLLRKGIKQ
jgi:hypothetical protein